MKINPKSQKGAITLVVLVSMLFLTAFLMSMYIRLANKAKMSAETTKQIAEQYNNIEEANTIYDSYFANTDIIPIYTREHLEKIGSGEHITINGKVYIFSSDAYYTMKSDLDLGGYYDESTGVWTSSEEDKWTPLPLTDNNGTQYEFTGVLDGLGHTITGLYIDNSEDYQGLFGALEGTVKNLNILGSYINANNYVGAVAGLNEGRIENCNNKAIVIGDTYVGGIAGNLSTNIVNCSNTGNVIGNTNVTGGYFKSITTGEIIEVWSNNVLEENAYFVSGSYTATAPKGFKVSKNVFEQTIEDGMVIQDENKNEFVWIPVTDELGDYYVSASNYYEPKELTTTWPDSILTTKPQYDSQEILTELYGEGYYTYTDDFKYIEEYAKMIEKVKQYNGFYIGRYETTIDSEGNIGTEYNTPVLTTQTVMYTKDEIDYPYRWYGLYQAGKNADVSGNGTDVQTAMIYGVLWDKTMDFIRIQKTANNTTYDVDNTTPSWHGSSNGHIGVVNSAQANEGDVALNIWDLESNAYEWTQESRHNNYRVLRGGYYSDTTGYHSASYRGFGVVPTDESRGYSSCRLVLYIK